MFAPAFLSRALSVVAILAALTALPAPPAGAAECAEPGGVAIPAAAAPAGDFVITATGWGHGVGMSQYGAQGAARLGCSAADILTTYYPGASVGSADTTPAGGRLRVGVTFRSLTDNMVRATKVVAAQGRLRWRLCSPRCAVVAVQPAGTAWTLRTQDDGSFALYQGTVPRWRGGSLSDVVRVRLSSRKVTREALLPAKTRQHSTAGRYRWGVLEFDSAPTARRPRSHVTLIVPSVELYLRGLAEMPSSWEPAALAAQAIVGRAYAVNRRDAQPRGITCGCHLYDSVADQSYVGYAKEAEGTNAVFGRRWVSAVDATAGRVLWHRGRVAVGYYSSSHGGHSESSRFTWGGEVPYLQPVDDSRWEMASSNAARSTAVALAADVLGAVFGVGTATSVTLPDPKGAGGRVGRVEAGYGGVLIKGTSGKVRVSGSVFRTKVNAYLGREAVRSTLFTVTS